MGLKDEFLSLWRKPDGGSANWEFRKNHTLALQSEWSFSGSDHNVPTYLLTLANNSEGGDGFPILDFVGGRGTADSQLPPQVNDTLGGIEFWSATSPGAEDYTYGGGFYGTVNGTVSPGILPTSYQLYGLNVSGDTVLYQSWDQQGAKFGPINGNSFLKIDHDNGGFSEVSFTHAGGLEFAVGSDDGLGFYVADYTVGDFPIQIFAGVTGSIKINGDAVSRDTIIAGNNDLHVVHVDADVDRLGIKTDTPAVDFDVNSDSIRIRTAKTPASAAAAGVQGEVAWDASFVYVCVATNTWKRAAIATW